LSAVDRVEAARTSRITTGELNRVVQRAADKHVPRPAKGNQPVRILFASQIGTAPPTIALKINQVGELHFSYLRYLENRIRDAFGFEGTPIRLKVRGRRRTVRS
jgi:GTP-binding protein